MMKQILRYFIYILTMHISLLANHTVDAIPLFSDTPYLHTTASDNNSSQIQQNPIYLAEQSLLISDEPHIIKPSSIQKETKKANQSIQLSLPKSSKTAVKVKQDKIPQTPPKKIAKKEAQSYHDNNASKKSITQGLTLKEAILKALKKSYKISAGREKVIQAKRKVDEKIAAYLPTLNLSANAGGAYLSPYQTPEEKFLKSDESLTLNQNLYAGGKHSNEIKREKANLIAAEKKFKDQVEEETLKIIDAYLSLIYQKKGIDITRANMLSLQKILDIVTTKEQNGAATKGDLNYIKSQVENASAALVKAESKYQNAVSFYEYYVGKLDQTTMPIQTEYDFALQDKNSTILLMGHNNSKLLIAQSKMQAEEYNLKALRSKFKPTLDLSITAKDKQSGYLAEPQEDRATALLSFNYNLYNGGKDKAKLLGSKSKIAQLQYQFIDIKESSEYNTKQVYENILSSLDTLKHTQNEVDANLKVIDSYWSAFKYGTQDIQALLLAQRALNRSQLDMIKEKQTYVNGYFKLMQQTGTLLQTLHLEDFANAKKIIQDKSIHYF